MDAKLIVIILILILTIALSISDFIHKSKEEKIDILVNWAKKAVYEAEEYFGGGTGALKLAFVYNKAVEQFPWFAKLLTYEEFNEQIIKPSLEWLNEQIAKNPNIKQLLGK